jgi:hypothetical protein
LTQNLVPPQVVAGDLSFTRSLVIRKVKRKTINGKDEVGMATVSELVEVVAAATEELLPTLRMMARRLIDDGVLPKAVGKRIPQVTPDDAAALLLAVLPAPLVKDATRTALAYGGLTYNGYTAPETTTAQQAVSKLLRTIPHDVNALDWSLEVCSNALQVVVHQPLPGPLNQTPTGSYMEGSLYIEPGRNPLHPPSKRLKRIAVLSGEALYAIGCALIAEARETVDAG